MSRIAELSIAKSQSVNHVPDAAHEAENIKEILFNNTYFYRILHFLCIKPLLT